MPKTVLRRMAIALAAAVPLASAHLAFAPALPDPVDVPAVLPSLAAAPEVSCAAPRVLGACACPGGACVRVERNQALAWVETTAGPADLLAPDAGLAAAPGAGALSAAGLAHTWEVHVWGLPVALLPANPVGLLYASEADALNWRTGAFDRRRGAAGASLLRDWPPCAATWSGGSAEPCIGAWGPLRPRQMRALAARPALASAITAIRALSLARAERPGLLPPVDARASLQQDFPIRSACLALGTLPLPRDGPSGRGVRESPNGRYAWRYWYPVSCCVGPGAPAACTTGPWSEAAGRR